MANILLVEPDYSSKFPPLGLMRISTFHKSRGDAVTFVRGRRPDVRQANWNRVYVSSLFTYELPRTVATIKYYKNCVPSPKDLIVGGIGATLLPQYLRDRTECTVVTGPLDNRGMLGIRSPTIADLPPDYGILDTTSRIYEPEDAYFCRATLGCIRSCHFCAVGTLEPDFKELDDWEDQVAAVRKSFGEKQHMVFLDNNILAIRNLERLISTVCELGFYRGAKRNNRQRNLDFNQGIDARLIDARVARMLSKTALNPVRLAFDHVSVEKAYRAALRNLVDVGFRSFTNYALFNFRDDPEGFYKRMRVNTDLSVGYGVRVTGFPMRYIPIGDVHRKHVSKGWNWKYLRGIQCILLATHGMVTPNQSFFEGAFGHSYEEFLEILAMPDAYIIDREKHRHNGATEWRARYRRLSPSAKREFVELLSKIHAAGPDRKKIISEERRFGSLLRHYYRNGKRLQ